MVYELSALTRVYGERTVLDIPRLQVAAGKIYALQGPNGAGKTTLLNILGFLEPPTSGRIMFRSQEVPGSERGRQALRKLVVMVDQHPILFTTSVYRNLEFGLKVREVPKAQRDRMINETLELVGMRPFAAAPAHLLSGGETQRVAIARALVVNPQVLLCDEPTASVDTEHQVAISNILRQSNQLKKITIVFTTHDRFQAAALGHQTLYLDRGRLAVGLHENLFPAVLYDLQGDTARCNILGRIDLKVGTRHRGKVRVFIDPLGLTLAAKTAAGKDANCFAGRVVRITAEAGQVSVLVDIGIGLTIFMPAEGYRRNPPLVGAQVNLVVPPEAIHIFG